MNITIITTTRNRPLAFSMLEQWVARQTLKPKRWLVINDGTEDYTYTMGQEVVRREPQEGEPHSLNANWLAALKRLKKTEWVFVMEDDDYYHPAYLETVSKRCAEADLVGVSYDLYWNLATRKFRRMYNMIHASLAATAFNSKLYGLVKEAALAGSVFLDMHIWAAWEGSSYLMDNKAPDGKPLHVGMKCMPGEPGLGIGHQPDGSSDYAFLKLIEWLGYETALPYVRLAESDHYK